MVLSDVVWWVMAMRLTKKRLWRVLVSVFLAGQMAVVVSLIAQAEWSRHTPKAVVSAVIIWHYFLFGALLALGTVVFARGWCGPGPDARSPAEPSRCHSYPGGTADAPGIPRRLRRPHSAVIQSWFGRSGPAQLDHFRVRRFTLSIPGLPRALDGTTIAHVSDTHVGGLTSGRVLREAANAVNALRADLVLFTGDLINYELADLSRGLPWSKGWRGATAYG